VDRLAYGADLRQAPLSGPWTRACRALIGQEDRDMNQDSGPSRRPDRGRIKGNVAPNVSLSGTFDTIR